MTGVSTRKILGCGNSRRNAYGSPSSPLLSASPQKLLDRDGFCDSATVCAMQNEGRLIQHTSGTGSLDAVYKLEIGSKSSEKPFIFLLLLQVF
jgi:hypothetical protein